MRSMLLVLALFLIPAIASAGTAPAPLPVPAGGIAILSPGTAEFGGYRIVVAPNGDAVAVDLAGKAARTLPPSLTKTLFADAAAAMPLSKLRSLPCSPAPTTPAPVMVTFNGETSPDMTCLVDATGAALFTDVQKVAHALYISNLRSAAVPRFAGGESQAPLPQPPAPQPQPLPVPGSYGGYGHM